MKTIQCIMKSIVLLALLGLVAVPASGATIFGAQIRASTPAFQLFNHINDDSTVANPGAPLFDVSGGVYGAAFREGVFYGVELENGTFKDFLITISHEGTARSARVSTNEIGFPSVEGLANVEGQLMGVSVDFPGHITKLISVDHETGVGTLIGSGSFNVIIVALAYDPSANVLYGAGIPFGGGDTAVNDPNLYTINPQTGATTLVGNLGTTIQGLSWGSQGLIGSFDRLYQINTSTGLATQIGITDYTDGQGTGPGIFNGIYALAAIAPTVLPSPEAPSLTIDGNDVQLTWVSQAGCNYHVEYRLTLTSGDWVDVSGVLIGQAGSMSFTHSGTAAVTGFYRLVKSLP